MSKQSELENNVWTKKIPRPPCSVKYPDKGVPFEKVKEWGVKMYEAGYDHGVRDELQAWIDSESKNEDMDAGKD
jgi:hypothetical protein